MLKIWFKGVPDTLNALLHRGSKFMVEKNYSSNVFYLGIVYLWKPSWFYIKGVLKISRNPATEPVLVRLLQSFTKYFETNLWNLEI